jgi:hypothetical protein
MKDATLQLTSGRLTVDPEPASITTHRQTRGEDRLTKLQSSTMPDNVWRIRQKKFPAFNLTFCTTDRAECG